MSALIFALICCREPLLSREANTAERDREGGEGHKGRGGGERVAEEKNSGWVEHWQTLFELIDGGHGGVFHRSGYQRLCDLEGGMGREWAVGGWRSRGSLCDEHSEVGRLKGRCRAANSGRPYLRQWKECGGVVILRGSTCGESLVTVAL